MLVIWGCNTAPIQGNFQQVCDKLVDMSPGDRATNMGRNGDYYKQTYGIHYDSVTDALYTLTGTGERDYILKGDLVRAMFLIK